jgi:hypothetical protein
MGYDPVQVLVDAITVITHPPIRHTDLNAIRAVEEWPGRIEQVRSFGEPVRWYAWDSTGGPVAMGASVVALGWAIIARGESDGEDD